MNTAKNIQQSQAQMALYLDLIEKADQFSGNNATLIQLSFPDNQEHATELHNEFLKAFEPFRNYLVDCAATALNELCPDMAEETNRAFTAILDRGKDNGLYTPDIQDELQQMAADEAEAKAKAATPDSTNPTNSQQSEIDNNA